MRKISRNGDTPRLSVANSIRRAIKVSRATLRELNNVSKGGGSRKRVLLRSIREDVSRRTRNLARLAIRAIRNNKQLFSPRKSLPARYLPRSIRRSVYCFKQGGRPPSLPWNVFPSRALSAPLKYKQLLPVQKLGVGGIYTGARSDLDNRQRASRPHWIIPDSPPPRHLLKQRGCPPQMSRNCDKEVANHWRNTRALSSSARSSYERLTFDDDFFLSF